MDIQSIGKSDIKASSYNFTEPLYPHLRSCFWMSMDEVLVRVKRVHFPSLVTDSPQYAQTEWLSEWESGEGGGGGGFVICLCLGARKYSS